MQQYGHNWAHTLAFSIIFSISPCRSLWNYYLTPLIYCCGYKKKNLFEQIPKHKVVFVSFKWTWTSEKAACNNGSKCTLFSQRVLIRLYFLIFVSSRNWLKSRRRMDLSQRVRLYACLMAHLLVSQQWPQIKAQGCKGMSSNAIVDFHLEVLKNPNWCASHWESRLV